MKWQHSSDWRPRAVQGIVYAVLVGALLLPVAPQSQAEVLEAWARTYNGSGQRDQAVAMAVDAFGDVYVTGFSIANDQLDLVTIKYAPDGSQIWLQRYEGAEGAHDEPSAITVNANNEVFVAGKSVSANGASSWILLKYDTDGNLAWVDRIEGSELVAADSSPIGVATDGSNCYVVGPKALPGEGDAFTVAKYSASGEREWVQFGESAPAAMALDGTGSVIVAGSAAGALDSYDILIAKIDPSGSPLWTSRYDGNGDDKAQSANDVCIDGDDNIYVAGGRDSGQGWQFLTLMYAPDGMLVWEASHAAPPGQGHEGHAVRVDFSGNVYVAGTTDYIVSGSRASDTSALKYDATGTLVWAARHVTPVPSSFSVKRKLAVDPWEGAIYVANAVGFTTMRYNPDGNLDWAISRPSFFGNALGLSPGSEIYLAGLTDVTDPPSPTDSGDLLTVKYTQTSNPSQPRVVVDPLRHETIIGSNVTFSAIATGPGPFTYQWRFNGRPLTNAADVELVLERVSIAAAGDYSVIVSNAAGYTMSTEARLVLHVPPSISSRAQTNTVLVGESITFSVTATGEAPLSYQWRFNGVAIVGATNSGLELSNLQESSSGQYTVEVRNAYGTVVSLPYQLSVVTGSLGLTLKGAWPGYARGPVNDVAVLGNRAYVSTAEGLAVFDITNPARPLWLGGHATVSRGRRIHVKGGYAYIIEDQRWTGSNWMGQVEVFDVSNPARPTLSGAFESNARNIVFADELAYISDFSGGLQIVDLSIPWQPVLVGAWNTNQPVVAVHVIEDRAYVAGFPSSLHIVDVSDPANPQRLGGYEVCPGQLRDVAVSGNYAYLADSVDGLVIVDISNPFAPQRAGGNGRPLDPARVRISGTRLYVMGNRWDENHSVADLVLYDISDPVDPVRISRTEVQSFRTIAGLDVAGDFAFVAAAGGGLQVFSFGDPANPRRVSGGETTGFARGISVLNNHAYLADSYGGVQVLDVSAPANPVRVGSFETKGAALDVQVQGDRAYVAESDSLLVANTSDPANLSLLSLWETGTLHGDYGRVHLANGLAFVIDGSGRLHVLDVSSTNAILVGSYAATNGRASGVDVVGNRAYLVGTSPINEDDDTGFLHILDVADPARISRLGTVGTTTLGRAVKVQGATAFVAGERLALTVVDVSTPANPSVVGQFDALRSAENIDVAGSYAYLVGPSLGLLALDVRQPSSPYRVAEYPFVNRTDEDEGCDIQVIGNLAYVTRGHDGLVVFEITGLPVINSLLRSGSSVVISWNGSPQTKLQRADSPTSANWVDVPASQGSSRATVLAEDSKQFFRLLKE